MNLLPCACGAQLANDGGVEHPVLGSAPQCFAHYNDVRAHAERVCPQRVAALDAAYAVQHAEGCDAVPARRALVASALQQLRLDEAPRRPERVTIFDVPTTGARFASALDAWIAAVKRSGRA